MGPQLPEGPTRMEHPPAGPVQAMLSWGWSGRAQHSRTDRYSRTVWHSRTGFGTAGLLLGTSATRGLPQSSPCTPGPDGAGDALTSPRCSRATRVPAAPSPELGGQRHRLGRGLQHIHPVQGPLMVKSGADGGTPQERCCQPPRPWPRRGTPTIPCLRRVSSPGKPLLCQPGMRGGMQDDGHCNNPPQNGPSPQPVGLEVPLALQSPRGTRSGVPLRSVVQTHPRIQHLAASTGAHAQDLGCWGGRGHGLPALPHLRWWGVPRSTSGCCQGAPWGAASLGGRLSPRRSPLS